MELEKASHFVKAAQLAFDADLFDACASLCYHVMFWAVLAMLAQFGIRRAEWRHGDLQQIFRLELVKKRHICPGTWGKRLRDSYELRCDAVYRPRLIFKSEAGRVLRYAREFSQKAEEVRK